MIITLWKFVRTFQNLVTSEKSVTLIFLSCKKSNICLTSQMVESRQEKKTKNGVARCHTVYIKYSILLLYHHLSLESGRNNWFKFLFDKLVTWHYLFLEIKDSLFSGYGKNSYGKTNIYTWFKLSCNQPFPPHFGHFEFLFKTRHYNPGNEVVPGTANLAN